MKLEFSRQIFEKFSNIKFHENPSSGSRVPCGRPDGRQDMTLIVAFHNFANAPKNVCIHSFPIPLTPYWTHTPSTQRSQHQYETYTWLYLCNLNTMTCTVSSNLQQKLSERIKSKKMIIRLKSEENKNGQLSERVGGFILKQVPLIWSN
jgi:hypothetical protein